MMSKSSAKTRNRGFVVLTSGPAGVGKSTLAKELVDRLNFEGMPAVKYRKRTTRTGRTLEVDGIDYEYVNPRSFELSIEEGKTVATYDIKGNRYGYPVQIAEDLRNGTTVVAEARLEGIAALRDYIRAEGFDSIVIPVLLHCDVKEAVNRVLYRESGPVSISSNDVEREHRLYKAKSGEYDYQLFNPDQNLLTDNEFISHLVERVRTIMDVEGSAKPNVSEQRLKEQYIENVVSKLFEGPSVRDVLRVARDGSLRFYIGKGLVEEYAENTGKSVDEINSVLERKLAVTIRYGILSVYFTQNERNKDMILDLIEMQIGRTPQYRYDRLTYSKVSAMSLAAAKHGQLNFCMSYSLSDPIEMPHDATPLHTFTIEAVLNGSRIPDVRSLEPHEANRIWQERKQTTSYISLPHNR